jgi:hypothetical protein
VLTGGGGSDVWGQHVSGFVLFSGLIKQTAG